MATLSQADTRRMYSWWWDSHISPKNSKWLQENLTDMDAKVTAMIKLINEDADSFARRAEMYYKKRPEFTKFVEEFYRAYRALAERYDHATGVIRQAHRTMADAFPNQIPSVLGEDSPAGSATGFDPQTPGMSTLMHSILEPEELQNNAQVLSASHTHDLKSNGVFTDDLHSAKRREGFGSGDQRKFTDGRVRKSLNYSEAEEKEQGLQTNESNSFQTRVLPISEHMIESETLTLKKALAQVEAEKEAGLFKYQQTFEKLSQLESEISRAKEDSRVCSERASQAEAEAQTLKEALSAVVAEKEANLVQYQKSLDKISELENTISCAQDDAITLAERASKAELEAQSLKDNLAKVAAEKDEALKQYMQSLEMIAKLENKLQCAEEDARKLTERAENSEREVEYLQQAILKLTEEKEAATLQYEQCLDTISTLEKKLSSAQEEAQRLNEQVSDGIAKLEGAEEHCLSLEKSNKSLHSELESLTLKMGDQSQELAEKQKEVGRLWTCIQEEHLRFVEAETAFQTLQHLHAQTQEEIRSMASELQNHVQVLRDLEAHNQRLNDEVQNVKEENKSLNELNISSAMSIADMRNEICSLREAKGKVEQEVELRVDQRNALQQEIYCLKEELNDLNKNQLSILTQVQAVGLDPECLESSVKDLLDENSKLKETCERERSEKVALLEKLQVLEELLQKNSILENSLSDLSAELEAVRGKIRDLEVSCQSLINEKSELLNDKATLTSQLHVANENLEKVSAKNTIVENSLSDACCELQSLKENLKSFEVSCEVLAKQKEDLACEKESLTSQLQATQLTMGDLEGRYTELEERYSVLEEEKECALSVLENLRISLDLKNREHDRFVHTSEAQVAGMESEMHLLQEESQRRKVELDTLLDKSWESDIQIFTLQRTALDLACEKESLISQLQAAQLTMGDLEGRYTKLEGRYSVLEKEKESTLSILENLRISLDLKNREHDRFVHTSEAQVAGMESEMHLLQEESQRRKGKLDTLLDKSWESDIQIFTLQRSALDLEGKSFSLLTEYEKLLEASTLSKTVISDLEQKNIEQEMEITCLSDNVTIMRDEICKLLKVLDIVPNNACQDRKDQVHLQHILHSVAVAKDSFCKTEEENNQRAIEILVLVTLLGQLKVEVENLYVQKTIISQEMAIKSEELAMFQSEGTKLKECNEKLKSKIREKDHKEELLEIEIKNLGSKLVDLQGAYQDLQSEHLQLHEESKSVTKEFLLLGERNLNLEDENNIILGEILSLDSLSVVLKNCATEKSLEVKMLDEELCRLRITNADTEDKLSLTQRKLKETLIENHNLAKALHFTEDELMTVKSVRDQFNHQVEVGKTLLSEKDIEIQGTEEKLYLTEIEKSVLHQILENLSRELSENKVIIEDQEKKILKLCGDTNQLSIENRHLYETGQLLQDGVHQLHEEHEKSKLQNEALNSELKNQLNEIEMLKTEMDVLLSELQASMFYHILYEQKILELAEACHSSDVQITSMDMDIKHLKERVITLGSENGNLSTQLAAYGPAIFSLSQCMSSLEKHCRVHENLQEPENQEVKGTAVANHVDAIPIKEDENAVAADVFTDLHGLVIRVQAIEQLVVQENVNMHSKLQAAIKQFEELKSESSRHRRKSKPTSEIFEAESGLLTKDIMLDHVSESSSYRIGSREQIEIWDTKARTTDAPNTEKDGEFHNHRHPASSVLVEKELGVDKLEISKRFTAPIQEGNKRKVLERLNSDVQKLTNLQITVQDLKRKLETTEKGKRGKAVAESETLKGQLNEAEAAIHKLFDLSDKLMKNVEDDYFSSDMKSAMKLEANGNISRRIPGQARRISEKIGQLQLEVQKVQFVLLKLDDEKERKEYSMMSESNRRVLLRDYLSGGVRTNRRKKTPFCACVQPPTQED